MWLYCFIIYYFFEGCQGLMGYPICLKFSQNKKLKSIYVAILQEVAGWIQRFPNTFILMQQLETFCQIGLLFFIYISNTFSELFEHMLNTSYSITHQQYCIMLHFLNFIITLLLCKKISLSLGKAHFNLISSKIHSSVLQIILIISLRTTFFPVQEYGQEIHEYACT